MQDNQPSGDIRIVHGQCIGGKTSSKGRLKRLYIKRHADELEIKLPKPLGYTLAGKVQPGMMLQVWVRPDKDTLKALMVMPGDAENVGQTSPSAADGSATPRPIAEEPSSPTTPHLCHIKVCTKGKCYKQGGRRVMQALEAAIAQDETFSTVVTIEPTGCLKNCKYGPAVKVSSGSKGGSKLYSEVQPQDTHHILQRHA